MSFSTDLKKDISSGVYKSTCCKKALLQGMLTARGRLEENSVIVSVDSAESAEFVSTLVLEIFSKTAEILPPPRGGRCKLVRFVSKAARSFIEEILSDNLQISYKCAYCQSAFLRGIYFACGRASDPNKQFCLEFSIGNRTFLQDFFNDLGIELKYTVRKSECILYTKNSGVMEDFFAMADLNGAAFDIMNRKIKNDFINMANRQRNLDTIGIGKAVAAATPQLEIISALKERQLLSKLPDDLLEIAILRIRNPEMSLAQLSRQSIPPLTKSGIKHRMDRLMKLGEELLKK